MKIRKLNLHNIKSYTDQEITFHEGVNFISGINGAGKSTIIEAIGYALFDYNPYQNIKDLIRYGAKSGAITVEFSANDDREYRIVRKIGSSSLWAVYDLESEGELDLHGAKDVRDWLKDALGIDRDIELSQLFQDIIGVPQGTFVGPFLETPAIRKKKFDAILNVEQYREANNNTSKALSLLNKGLQAKDTDLKIMTEQVKDFDNINAELSLLEKTVEALKNKLNELAVSRKTNEDNIKNLEDIKTQLDKANADIKILLTQGDALQQKQKDLTKELEVSKEAKKQVLSAEPGYKGYMQLEEEVKNMEGKRQQKEKLEKELNQLKQNITAIETQISTKSATLEQQQKEIVENLKTIELQAKEHNEAINLATKELDLFKNKQSAITIWRQAEEPLELLITQIDQANRDIKSKNEQISTLLKEEKELQQRLDNLSSLEEHANKYDVHLKALNEAREEYKVMEAQLKTQEKNCEQTRGGKCPFLGTDCLNVKGNLDDYFAKQISETQQRLTKLKEKGLNLSKEFEQIKDAREMVIKLQGDKQRLTQVIAQKEKLSIDIKNIFSEVVNNPLQKTIENLTTASNLTFEKHPLLQETEHLTEAHKELQVILKHSKSAREKSEKELTEELNLRTNHVTKLKADYNNALNNLKQLKAKEASITKDKEALLTERAKADQLKNQSQQIVNQLSQYTNLNDELEKAKIQQEKYRQDYDTYMKNKAEADKSELLENSLNKVTQQLADNKTAITELQTSRDNLNSKFNPEEFEIKKQELDKLKQEEATEKQILLERQKDLHDNKYKVQEMTKIIKKMQQLKQQMASDRKKLTLLDIIRTTLNNAGPPIAKVYLENLSREANELYRHVSHENAALEWRENYEIVLLDNQQGHQRQRTFKQFSGGEQMTAALAVRLALLKQQSRVKVGFFDEPTANLDSERRMNLAETIPHVTGGFDQIFIISHDDTFDEITENVIQLKKDDGEGSSII